MRTATAYNCQIRRWKGVFRALRLKRYPEYALEQIYNVINARYLKARPTIITTNLNFKDIEKEQEDIMLGRIYSRIIEMCLPLRVIGVDRRKIQSKEKLKKAQNLIDE
ncbi:TPA: hypothetical protein TZ828_001169 [Streptococcus suis]|nr:hypothetical protein [Streptococcus suis]